MSGHTAGPFKARGQSVEGPCGITVAYCGTAMLGGVDGSYSIGRDEALANAVLFAEAPELLAVLKEYVEWQGAVHVGECPEDDICRCAGKVINDRVNGVIAKVDGR